MRLRTTLLFLFCVSLCAEPPRKIPSELFDAFTMNNTLPVFEFYFDGTKDGTNRKTLDDGSYVRHFEKKDVDHYIKKANRKETWYYGRTDTWLYQALEAYPIAGKTVGIIGSVIPWYESIILAYDGIPITIEYTKIITDDERLTTMTVEEFKENPQTFDVIISISSIEHDGLGRYGDPINPTGDLETMSYLKSLLNENGYMLLAVPLGPDCLYWNAHRVYGKQRLPLLTKEWELFDSFGFDKSRLSRDLGKWDYQPVLCLSPKAH